MRMPFAFFLGLTLVASACGSMKPGRQESSRTAALVRPALDKAYVVKDETLTAVSCEKDRIPSPNSCTQTLRSQSLPDVQKAIDDDFGRQQGLLVDLESKERARLVDADATVQAAQSRVDDVSRQLKDASDRSTGLNQSRQKAEQKQSDLVANLRAINEALVENPNQPLLIAERNRLEGEMLAVNNEITSIRDLIAANKDQITGLNADLQKARQDLVEIRASVTPTVTSPALVHITEQLGRLNTDSSQVKEALASIKDTGAAYVVIGQGSPYQRGLELVDRAMTAQQWTIYAQSLATDLSTQGTYHWENTLCCPGCDCLGSGDYPASMVLVPGLKIEVPENLQLRAQKYGEICIHATWDTLLSQMQKKYPTRTECNGEGASRICDSYTLYYPEATADAAKRKACEYRDLALALAQLPWAPQIFGQDEALGTAPVR